MLVPTAYRWCPAGITEGFLVTGVIVECLKQEGANVEDQCEDWPMIWECP